MPILQSQVSLAPFNTFGIAATAKQLVKIRSIQDLKAIISIQQRSFFILGGGSNILFQQDIDALILKNEIQGIQLINESEKEVILAVGGGVNWHQFVIWCVQQNLGGIENLSLIPGTVGAAPIQNIGAYGVELKDVFEGLDAIELENGKACHFSKQACEFGYRDSIFKRQWKGKLFIHKVYFRLTKKGFHQLNTSYGAIQKVLEQQEISIQTISNAVVKIRQSKLPDPSQIGNAGSFFKNPVISKAQFQTLEKQFPNIVHYSVSNTKEKIPAGWLIEQCGWKGKRVGNTGSYKNQALVLVNHGGASGQEIFDLSTQIIASVQSKFGIQLEREVNVIT